MSSRERILATLRANKAPFASVAARPASYLPVTQLQGPPDDLLARFTTELERLTGKVYRASDQSAAIQQVLALIGDESSVLLWNNLPALSEALAEHHITGVIPQFLPDERFAALQTLEPIRIGITGAEAGLATTGTLVLATNPAQARLVSLLPPVHVVLLSLDRLYANMESWLASTGRDTIAQSSGVTFITGPSRTSDIEMQTILGVHGPGEVHVIIF